MLVGKFGRDLRVENTPKRRTEYRAERVVLPQQIETAKILILLKIFGGCCAFQIVDWFQQQRDTRGILMDIVEPWPPIECMRPRVLPADLPGDAQRNLVFDDGDVDR